MSRWYPIECEHGYDCCPECDGPRRDPLTLRVVGVDLGSPDGDYSAAPCPHCGTVAKWRGTAPTRCSGCRRRHNFAGLHIVR